MFAKLFESEKYGQVLFVLDVGRDGGPTITVSCEPKDYGVCSITTKFEESAEGWEDAEDLLNMTELEHADAWAKQINENVNRAISA